MAILVILVLVALWAAVLVPPILRSRSSSGMGGVSDFMDHLRSLGARHAGPRPTRNGQVLHGPVGGPLPGAPRGGRQPIVPPLAYRPMPGGISPVQRRRRNVLTVLAAAVGVTFLFALMAQSPAFWALFLVTVGALGGYCYLLRQLKLQRATMRHAAPARVAVPITRVDDVPKVGDNVILLRRNVG